MELSDVQYVTQYANEHDRIAKINSEAYELFRESLAPLSKTTQKRHLAHVSDFLDWLLEHELVSAYNGITSIGSYLLRVEDSVSIDGDGIDTHYMTKDAARAIKKLYKCLLENEKISNADYEFVCLECEV